MPWFVYNFPLDTFEPTSYTVITGTPTCTGNSLCAIYTTAEPNTNPALPVLTEDVQLAISDANSGIITTGVTRLQPTPGA